MCTHLWPNCMVGYGTGADFRPLHDDVIKCKHFPRNWPLVRGFNRSPVNSTHKGQWHGVFVFSLICVWINGWVNNREAGDLRRYRAHYDFTVMTLLMASSLVITMYAWFAEITHPFVEFTCIAKLTYFGHGQHHRHFADFNFKYTSLYENYNVLISIITFWFQFHISLSTMVQYAINYLEFK